MDENYKEVYYDQYCKSCKYEKLDDAKDPCNECMEEFANLNSHKPIRWEAKERE